MMNPAEYQVEQIQFFFLMFVRMLAMVLVFPVFGSRNVPWQLKVGFAFLLSMILFPLLHPRVAELPNNFLPYGLLIVKEALVGLVIGFAVSLLFTAVSFAGFLIDMQVGFSFAQSVDPISGTTTSVLGYFKLILFTLLFLALDGQHFLVLVLSQSFEKIPIAGANLQFGKLSEAFAYFITAIFEVAVKLSAPVLILVLLSSVASGVLSRTMPQMNLFVVDLPVKIAIALIGLALSMPVLFYVFEKAYNQLQDDIFKLLLLMV